MPFTLPLPVLGIQSEDTLETRVYSVFVKALKYKDKSVYSAFKVRILDHTPARTLP